MSDSSGKLLTSSVSQSDGAMGKGRCLGNKSEGSAFLVNLLSSHGQWFTYLNGFVAKIDIVIGKDDFTWSASPNDRHFGAIKIGW
jgi:hypothetical protein